MTTYLSRAREAAKTGETGLDRQLAKMSATASPKKVGKLNSSEEFLTISDAALVLGISYSGVHNAITRGNIKKHTCDYTGMVLVSRADIENWNRSKGWNGKVHNLEKKIELQKNALDAAVAFIESHVADPDITAEMRENYKIYQEAMKEL